MGAGAAARAQTGAGAASGGPRSTLPEPAGGHPEGRLLIAVHGARVRDSGRELKQEKPRLDTRKTFSTVRNGRDSDFISIREHLTKLNALTPRTVKQQHRLPWELVQAPSVEVFRTRSDKALVRPRRCPGCEQEVALEPSSGPSRPGLSSEGSGQHSRARGAPGRAPWSRAGNVRRAAPSPAAEQSRLVRGARLLLMRFGESH